MSEECQHEWDDTRPTVVETWAVPPDCNYVPCKKCGAPLQLARRQGMWEGTPLADIPGEGPPWYYGGRPR